MDLEGLFLQCVPVVAKLAASQCRRYRFSREEVEDFTQEVNKKIWSNGCAVLRQWKQRSKLPAYLAVVVAKALLDHVDHLWGKWRPSAGAVELGWEAVELERLLDRDKLSFDEASRILRIDRKVQMSESELAGLAARLRPRLHPGRGRQESGGDAAGKAAAGLSSPHNPLASPPESAEDRILREERASRHEKAFAALKAAMASLPDEDFLIVKLRIWDEFKIVDIARHLRLLAEKPLYGRVTRIYDQLREIMERLGIAAEDIGEILRDADS
jgi:RNA polymerase sigma factor (sigma-70 family)